MSKSLVLAKKYPAEFQRDEKLIFKQNTLDFIALFFHTKLDSSVLILELSFFLNKTPKWIHVDGKHDKKR